MNESAHSLLNRAIELAIRYHSGTYDRYGTPYILHTLRVMDQVATADEKIIAVLHDTMEDCGVTSEMLIAEGIPEKITADIDRLSRRDGEDYDAYVERVMTSRRAARIKIADLEDNMDIRRMPEIGDDDIERLRRYHRSRMKLLVFLAMDDQN